MWLLLGPSGLHACRARAAHACHHAPRCTSSLPQLWHSHTHMLTSPPLSLPHALQVCTVWQPWLVGGSHARAPRRCQPPRASPSATAYTPDSQQPPQGPYGAWEPSGEQGDMLCLQVGPVSCMHDARARHACMHPCVPCAPAASSKHRHTHTDMLTPSPPSLLLVAGGCAQASCCWCLP